MQIQMGTCAGGVCIKWGHSVTSHIRISLHDSPPDQHTHAHMRTHAHFFFFFFCFSCMELHTLSGCLQVSASTFLYHLQLPDNLKKERKTEKQRARESGWRREILALKYLKLLCGYIKHFLVLSLWYDMMGVNMKI